MNNIIPYLAIFTIFTLVLISKMSINPALRAKFSVAGILGFFVLGAYLFYFQIDKVPYMSGAHIIAYSMALPDVIARLVNMRRIKSKSIQIETNTLIVAFGFLGTGIFTLLTALIMFFLFKEMVSPRSETVFDVKYFLASFNTLLVFISSTIWIYLFSTQKTTFYSEGLLYNGEFWKWSDFEFYSWSRRIFENDTKELALATAKHVWLPAQIKIKIPPESKKRIEVLLEKKLESL